MLFKFNPNSTWTDICSLHFPNENTCRDQVLKMLLETEINLKIQMVICHYPGPCNFRWARKSGNQRGAVLEERVVFFSICQIIVPPLQKRSNWALCVVLPAKHEAQPGHRPHRTRRASCERLVSGKDVLFELELPQRTSLATSGWD